MKKTAPDQTQIHIDQVEQLYQHMPESIAGNLVNSCILAFIQWKIIAHSVVLLWLGCMLGITLFRYAAYRRYRKIPKPPAEPGFWQRLFIFGLTLSGLLWGAAGVVLFPAHSVPHQIIVTFVIGGMVAGAAASTSAVQGAFLFYCFPALLPVIANLIRIGGEVHVAMALMATLYAILSLATSYHIHKILAQSFALRLENRQEIEERRKAEQQLLGYKEDLEKLVQDRTAELYTVNRELEIRVKETEDARRSLEESEERLHLALKAGGQGIYDLDLRTGRAIVSPEYASMLGYDPEEFEETNEKWQARLHPDEREQVASYYQRYIRGELDSYEVEFRQRTRAGDWIWILSLGKIVQRDNLGTPERMIGTHTDITRLKQTEAALHESNSRYLTLIETIPHGVQECDTNGVITFSNAAHHKIFGYVNGEFLGRPIWDVIPSDSEKQKLRDYLQYLLVKQPPPEPYFAKNRTKDGRIIDIQADWNYKRDKNGQVTGFIAIITDITDRKRMEEELLKAHKLESLGILAGGIAHDFNNLLTAITGNISLAKDLTTAADQELAAHLTEAEKAAERAKGLTMQLLTFSKGGAPITDATSVASLLQESVSFLLSGTSIGHELELPQDIWPVEADAGQISQVIQNLVTNAKEAMPDGGKITISARNLEISRDSTTNLIPGEYVQISVRDDGPGIPKEIERKIFDPYFTTKSAGNGLGLAICYSIIKRHKGLIALEPGTGKGAMFQLYLPAARQKPKKAAAGERISGSGRILVMDDEDMVRMVVTQLLSRLGYETASARDGSEAIAKYLEARENGNPFHAVLMDLTIPGGMGGKEAIAKLLAIDQDATVIVSSGYANDPIMSQYREYGFKQVISKPYNLEKLSRILHEALQK